MKRHLLQFLSTAGLLLLGSCADKAIITPRPAAESQTQPTTAITTVTPTNAAIRYVGRWDFSNPAQYVSNWGGAYFKVAFTGTTAKLKLGNTSDYFVRLDNGPWVSFLNASGTVNLTPTPLAGGTHTLTVAQGKDYAYEFQFAGLELDPGATVSAPAVSNLLLEYIGDSITAGYKDAQSDVSAYGWVCAEALGGEHTQLAWPGIKLLSGASSKGMDYQYFKLKGNYNDPAGTTAPWDFTHYTPQVVVVNLGTNDSSSDTSDPAFQAAYTSFLATIRSKFPQAQIFALRTFAGLWETPTQAAVNAQAATGDSQVHFVNTAGWLTPNTSDFLPGDNTHPSESGHQKAGNLLKVAIDPYVGGAPILADGTYKLVNRNSGLVLDAQGQRTANGTPVQQWSYSGGDNQRWAVTNLGNNAYKIVGVQSGKSLDVTGQLVAAGAAIELYDYNGGNNQRWTLSPTSNGYLTITGVQSGQVVEVEAQSTAAGALVKQYTPNGGTHQQWLFQKL